MGRVTKGEHRKKKKKKKSHEKKVNRPCANGWLKKPGKKKIKAGESKAILARPGRRPPLEKKKPGKETKKTGVRGKRSERMGVVKVSA